MASVTKNTLPTVFSVDSNTIGSVKERFAGSPEAPFRRRAADWHEISPMPSESDVPPARALSLSEMVGEWIIAQVLSQHEKSVAGILERADVQHYLPLFTREHDGAGNRRNRALPLFRGYLFVCCRNEDDRYELVARYNTSGQKIVYGIIEIVQQAKFVKELLNIETAVLNGTIQPYTLPAVGQKCRILDGAFRDCEGTVVEAGKKRLVVIRCPEIMGKDIAIAAERIEIIE